MSYAQVKQITNRTKKLEESSDKRKEGTSTGFGNQQITRELHGTPDIAMALQSFVRGLY